MFICAPPTTMEIVSPKQAIASLRHPEHQKPASFYCHDENHYMCVCSPYQDLSLYSEISPKLLPK